jgi:hypothetical protein
MKTDKKWILSVSSVRLDFPNPRNSKKNEVRIKI